MLEIQRGEINYPFLPGTNTPAGATKQSDVPGKTDKGKKKNPQAGQERGLEKVRARRSKKQIFKVLHDYATLPRFCPCVKFTVI